METSHTYLWLSAILLFSFFIWYVFVHDHKEGVGDSQWAEKFRRVQIDPNDMAHDDNTWYHNRESTCVAYGDPKEECSRHENYCAGGRSIGHIDAQVNAIKEALQNKGTHPECPLIYAGAD